MEGEKHEVHEPCYDQHRSTTKGDEESITSGRFGGETLQVEMQGIRPVPENERTHTSIFDNFTVWFSIDTTLANMSIGVLAIPVYNLGFWDSFACILVCNFIIVLPGAFFVTLGSRYGMRQMVLTRYSFGMIGTVIPAVANAIICLGWACINLILAGQLLSSVSEGKLPNYAGILLVAGCTLIVSLFGYHFVHKFERFAWLPLWVVFFCMLGVGAKSMSVPPIPSSDATEAGNFLSFAAAVIGYNPGWATCSADYSVKQPANTNRGAMFILAFLGAFIPSVLLQTLGVGLTTGLANNSAWASAYESNDVGGLVGAALDPLHGFGKFLVVVLAVGIMSANIPDGYSVGLSLQSTTSFFWRVPQWCFTTFAVVVYTVAAIFGAEHFSVLLNNFLLLLTYYTAPYVFVLILEHNVFRKGVYPVEDWNSIRKLPVGLAAVAAVCVGFGGALIGMNQTWFVGPLAKLIGDYGGDLGFELSIVLSIVTYLVLRYFELQYFGR